MQYSFRPNLLIKEVTLSLDGATLKLSRNGRERKTIDLHAARKLQQYSSGSYVDEQGEHVRDKTCRLFHAGRWPVMLRSTSYRAAGRKGTVVVKDQNPEFTEFYRQLLEQLESINPDLPVEQGDRGYAWMFVIIGVLMLAMFAALGYFIVVGGNGDLETRLIFGPLSGVAGIVFCYFCCKGAMSYWPERRTIRDLLSTL
ncbi:MAG: hypothetical protein AAGD11_00935 [Planctomycetota bacterium]